MKHLSSFIDPRTWIIIISNNFKCFGKVWDMNWKALITFHKQIRVLTIYNYTLSVASATTFSMVLVAFDFMVNLKSPCCASKSQLEITKNTTRIDLPLVATPHGRGLPSNSFNNSKCQGKIMSTFAYNQYWG